VTIEPELIELVEPETGGDPQDRCKYTRSSLRSLAKRLGRGSPTSIGRLLKPLGYSLKTNVKRLIGKVHPQRDWQYRFIRRTKALFIHAGQPVISVDAQKSELIGNFKNSGRRYCQKADTVNTYDFPSEAECQDTPYGIYDNQANHALVRVGQSAVTSEFAVASIKHWWERFGVVGYRQANHLLIEADAGGCNGYRGRLWKLELQKLVDEIGFPITVCHYPSGASKFNPIEHRLFSQISRNWAGQPLRTLTIRLNFLRGTTTTKALKVDAELDTSTYEKGIQVSDKEMKSLNLHRRRICPDLSYTIKPRKSGSRF
jgi:hypothetical protein